MAFMKQNNINYNKLLKFLFYYIISRILYPIVHEHHNHERQQYHEQRREKTWRGERGSGELSSAGEAEGQARERNRGVSHGGVREGFDFWDLGFFTGHNKGALGSYDSGMRYGFRMSKTHT